MNPTPNLLLFATKPCTWIFISFLALFSSWISFWFFISSVLHRSLLLLFLFFFYCMDARDCSRKPLSSCFSFSLAALGMDPGPCSCRLSALDGTSAVEVLKSRPDVSDVSSHPAVGRPVHSSFSFGLCLPVLGGMNICYFNLDIFMSFQDTLSFSLALSLWHPCSMPRKRRSRPFPCKWKSKSKCPTQSLWTPTCPHSWWVGWELQFPRGSRLTQWSHRPLCFPV